MTALLQVIGVAARSAPPDNAAWLRVAYVAAALVYGGYGLHLVRRLLRTRARLQRTPIILAVITALLQTVVLAMGALGLAIATRRLGKLLLT